MYACMYVRAYVRAYVHFVKNIRPHTIISKPRLAVDVYVHACTDAHISDETMPHLPKDLYTQMHMTIQLGDIPYNLR